MFHECHKHLSGSRACHWIEPSRGDMAKSLQNPFFPDMNLFKLPLFLWNTFFKGIGTQKLDSSVLLWSQFPLALNCKKIPSFYEDFFPLCEWCIQVLYFRGPDLELFGYSMSYSRTGTDLQVFRDHQGHCFISTGQMASDWSRGTTLWNLAGEVASAFGAKDLRGSTVEGNHCPVSLEDRASNQGPLFSNLEIWWNFLARVWTSLGLTTFTFSPISPFWNGIVYPLPVPPLYFGSA